MNPTHLDWPPPYTIKRSGRSKRLSIRISERKGLELVIPLSASQKKAIEFLNLKYDWVQKHRHILQAKPEVTIILPETIHLETIGELWQVRYGQRISSSYYSSDATQTLLLKQETMASVLHLKKWLKQKAKVHLAALTQQYSQQYGIPYNSLNVRYQRTRWGSCSQNKNINLNCKLMLLPIELTHYIIVHELIHTRHFNHSPDFWAAVSEIVPNQLELRKQLKTASLPRWLEN